MKTYLRKGDGSYSRKATTWGVTGKASYDRENKIWPEKDKQVGSIWVLYNVEEVR